MTQSEVIRFDMAVKRIIRRELAEAHKKWGERFDLLCIERSWGRTLDDMEMLSVIRRFNRSGSFFGSGVLGQIEPSAP
jgi:hypothetical protein